MSFFSDAIRVGLDAGKAIVSERVRYTSVDGDHVSIMAIPGSSSHETFDQDNNVITFKTSDWHIDVCDLAKVNIVPRKGDEITHEVGTKRLTYMVTLEGSDDVYQFSDRGQTRYRVHTMLKGSINK